MKLADDYTTVILMNKNTPVLEFFYDRDTHSVLKINQVFNEEHAPIGISNYKTGISRKLFNEWWNNRSIPASRENFTRVMQELKIGSSMELLEKSFGLSLSDQYWVKPSEVSLNWSDINFFENSFSEDIGRLLLGQIDAHLNLDVISPDNASDGDLIKKWKIIDGERYLIKGGNPLNNQEPFNEVVATCLFERILQPGEFVPYFLIQDEGKIYSACKTMVSTNEELVSAWAIDSTLKLRGNDSLHKHYLDACKTLGICNAENHVNKMLTCDFIIANFDRHYRNFGAIRNIETLEWVGPAPIYDSGSSLWAKFPSNEIRSANYTSKPFKKGANEQLMLVSDLSWLNSSALLGFEKDVEHVLSQNPLMEEKRISAIVHRVKENISFVLEKKQELEKRNVDCLIQNAVERSGESSCNRGTIEKEIE